jgi:hypothetical protein
MKRPVVHEHATSGAFQSAQINAEILYFYDIIGVWISFLAILYDFWLRSLVSGPRSLLTEAQQTQRWPERPEREAPEMAETVSERTVGNLR